MRYLILTLAIIFLFVTSAAAVPRINFVSPQQGQIISGNNVDISVSYDTHAGETVTRVELEIDSEIVQQRDLEQPRSRGICSFLINADDYSSGKHSAKINLYSKDGIVGSVSSTIEVAAPPPDITPPVIKILNIKSGQPYSGEVEIVVQATDDSDEPPLVSLSIDNTVKLIKNNPPYNYVWDTTLQNDGVHLIEAWAVDAAGNQALAEAIQLTVRNQIEVPELLKDDTTATIPAAESPVEMDEQIVTAVEDIPPVPTSAPAVAMEDPTTPEEILGEEENASKTEQIEEVPTKLIPADETLSPLVEFLEPISDEEKDDSEIKKPESPAPPIISVGQPKADAGKVPISLEVPTLGTKLTAPEQLAPTAPPKTKETKTENP